MTRTVVAGHVLVDGEALDIRDLRIMRDWVVGNRIAPEGAHRTNHMPTYGQCIDIVEADYPGGVRGFLDDRVLV